MVWFYFNFKYQLYLVPLHVEEAKCRYHPAPNVLGMLSNWWLKLGFSLAKWAINQYQSETFFSVGYGSLRSASFAKIATLNAIEITKCKDENQNSFCIKNHEKRLRDLDLGSSGGFQKHENYEKSRKITDIISTKPTQFLFENYY